MYWLMYLGHHIRLLKGLQRYLCPNTIWGEFEQGCSDILKGIARDTYIHVLGGKKNLTKTHKDLLLLVYIFGI